MKTTTANPVTSEMSHSRTTFMVKLALMVAIIFVMAFSPLGYLRTPGLTITFLTVPVAVGAIILGPTAGAICGGAFGLTSAIMALVRPKAPPQMAPAVGPRIMAPTATGTVKKVMVSPGVRR